MAVPAAIPVAALVAGVSSLAVGVANLVKGLAGDANEKREAFVKHVLERANEEYPDYNVALIHTEHEATGEYVHRHEEVSLLGTAGSPTIGYEIYLARKGAPFSLTNKGDGGWINWGYSGDFDRSGQTITART